MPTILTYHRLGDVDDDFPKSNLYITPLEFEDQIQYLIKKKYLFITLDSIISEFEKESVLPKKCVAITFDDTTIDNYKLAFPILKKYNVKATFFVVADRALGLIDDEFKNDFATIDQIKEMAQEEFIDIGSHTCTHPKLTKITPEALEYEIINSKKKLEDALGKKVNFFCYPYGDFNDNIAKMVKRAKYLGATSTIRDNRNRRKHRYYMKRVMVMRKVELSHFAYYFSPLYHLEHYRKNKKLWGKYK